MAQETHGSGGVGAEPSDGELVRSAQAGDRRATEALFRRHFATTARLAYRLAPRCYAEDVAQDVLVEALLNLKKLVTPEAFVGWLRGITVRTVSQQLRRRRVLNRLGFGDSPDDFEIDQVIAANAPIAVSLELREVYQAMARLPVEERMALALSRIEGLSNDEVAAAMGLSLATVKRRLANASRSLEGLRDP